MQSALLYAKENGWDLEGAFLFEDLVIAYSRGLGLGDSSALSPVPNYISKDNKSLVVTAK
jgi:hypothetical protein